MKTFTIRASETGARLDSDVHQGGGSDDTKVLQQALDRAGVGRPLELIMDGAALVRGLRLHSNTTIRCLDRACGFYLADGANEPVVRNATYATGEIVEHDIRLLGGTYNGNCPHQEHSQPDHTPLTGMAFLGVRDLAIRDVAMLNARTYGILLANWYRVDLEDILFETEPYLMYQNQDGVHVNGPGRFLTARNIQGGAEDDFFALNADDGARGKMSEFRKLSNIRQLSVNGMSVYQGAADGGPRQDVIVVDGHVASLSIRDVDVFEEGPNGGAILHKELAA